MVVWWGTCPQRALVLPAPPQTAAGHIAVTLWLILLVEECVIVKREVDLLHCPNTFWLPTQGNSWTK